MNRKLQLLLVALFMVLATNSQTLYVDGWDWPIGNRGYAPDGVTEIDLEENIDPEINNLYPNLLYLNNPDRECTGDCLEGDSLYNYGDIGEYNGKGIHIGEDWNFGSGDDDAGMEAFAPANGQVVAIILVNGGGPTVFGWMVKLKHYYSDGSHKYTTLKHVTTLDSVSGGICLSSSDFTVSVGDWVLRGQPIARIATGYDNPTYATHLHFEMQDGNFDYDLTGDWYPRDNAKQSYGGAVNCVGPCLNSGVHSGGIAAGYVEIAYLNASRDGFIDPSDYIQLNRPSTYMILAPEIEWQNTIGGSNDEIPYVIQQTSDGGYIIGGGSSSNISGDKSEDSKGGRDYWVVKLNHSGDSIEWQRTIGGPSWDELRSLKQTADGGYILGGYSDSDAAGDKTEASMGGSIDYWIVKLNSIGVIEWQNTIGGNDYDFLYSIDQTNDGGYILAGSSYSGVSGDKTEPNFIGTNIYDYWVVKLDPTGQIIEWQKTLGGGAAEEPSQVIQTSDGGYLVGGWSFSGISGNKTEDNMGGPLSTDYWIVKLTNSGDSIEWQNTIGGNADDRLTSLQQTSDGGYIIGGFSYSGMYGDKTEETTAGGPYDSDYWIVKLTNSGDSIEWQNSIGGNSTDWTNSIQQTSDGDYIIGGSSSSEISGDKTEANVGQFDYWIVKLNSAGDSIKWQKTIGGGHYDELKSISLTTNNGYILAGYSTSNISGDKEEPCFGYPYPDFWIVKLFGNCLPTTEICNSIDDDCDGLIDNAVVETVGISAGGPTTFCQGSSVVLTATYSGSSIQWKKDGVDIAGAINPTYTATTKGIYTATTMSVCDTSTSLEIVVNVAKNPPAVIVAEGPTTFCAGESVVLTANSGAGLSYQWYKSASPIVGATNISYTATTTGNYRCRVTKTATGCFKNSNSISVSITCKEGPSQKNVTIYPNPASGKIYVDLSQLQHEPTAISILNSVGESVLNTSSYLNDIIEVNLSALPKGLYIINIYQSENIIYSQKLILE